MKRVLEQGNELNLFPQNKTMNRQMKGSLDLKLCNDDSKSAVKDRQMMGKGSMLALEMMAIAKWVIQRSSNLKNYSTKNVNSLPWENREG